MSFRPRKWPGSRSRRPRVLWANAQDEDGGHSVGASSRRAGVAPIASETVRIAADATSHPRWDSYYLCAVDYARVAPEWDRFGLGATRMKV